MLLDQIYSVTIEENSSDPEIKYSAPNSNN